MMIAQNTRERQLEEILTKEVKSVFGVSIREPVDELLERIRAFEEQFVKPNVDTTKTFDEAKRVYMRSYLDTLLIRSYGVVRRASQQAGVAHTTLYRVCEMYDVRVDAYRTDLALPEKKKEEHIAKIVKDTLDKYETYIPSEQKQKKDACGTNISEKASQYVHLQLPTLKQAEEAFERAYLQEMLEKNACNVKNAAEQAAIHSRTFYRMMDAYDLGKGKTENALPQTRITETCSELKAA